MVGVEKLKRKDFEATPEVPAGKSARLSSISATRAAFDTPRLRPDDGAQAGPSKARTVDPPSNKRITNRVPSRSETPSNLPLDDPPKKMQLHPLPKFAPPRVSRSSPAVQKGNAKPLVTPPRPERFMQPKRSPSKSATNLITANAAALFNSVRPVEKKPVFNIEGGVRLLENVPKAPKIDDDWAGEGNGEVQWSPPKRKKNFRIVGLASRATTIINSVKTDHTLWIHNISRTLTAHSATPLTPLLLSKLLTPSVRLRVVEILSFGVTGVAEVPLTPELWQESRTVTAMCSVVDDDDQAEAETGLVIFSLHNRPRNSAGPMAVSVPRRRGKQRDGSVKMDSVSLFVPGNPFDLRYIEVGSECWVWEKAYEIVLNADGVNSEAGAAGAGAAEGGEMIEDDVFWDSRPEAVRLQENAQKLAGMVQESKALVCSKFGLLV